jgi:hypothetical protein
MKFSINFVFQILQKFFFGEVGSSVREHIKDVWKNKQGFKYTGQSLELGQ